MKLVKYQVTLIALTVFLLFGCLGAAPAQAGNIADITFETNPLFGNIEIMPGDSVTKSVNVTNKITSDLSITTIASDITDEFYLGDQMNLTIKKGAMVLYSGAMSAFFSAGNINLGTLGAGQTAQFDYAIYFKFQAGDSFQDKTMSFDISVTAQAPESVGGETFTVASSGGGSAGGSSGGSYAFDDLIISNIGAISTTDTSITVTWLTNKFATSRVIYDLVSHPDLSLALPPDYGYANSTVLDPAKVTGHTVIIAGLTPGTAYYLRPLSGASPEKYGGEVAVTTTIGGAPGTGVMGVKINSANNSDNNQIGAAGVRPEVLGIKIAGAELTPTGFSQDEFISLLALLSVLIASIVVLRKYQI